MAFVNEYVSEDDVKKYRLEELLKQFGRLDWIEDPLPGFRLHWTIDRERDVFIMKMRSGREEFSNCLTFAMWWKGSILNVELKIGGDGSLVGKVTTIWSLTKIYYPDGFSGSQAQVAQDLKDALSEYKVSGVTWPVADHEAVFEF